jgi:hypothetical protein
MSPIEDNSQVWDLDELARKRETTLCNPSALTAGERLMDAAVIVYQEARKAGKGHGEAVEEVARVAVKAVAGLFDTPICSCGKPSAFVINGMPKCYECGKDANEPQP